jgi:hypothetical protein
MTTASTSLATLLVQESQNAIYNRALSIATSLGLPVTAWQVGDPTRSMYQLEAATLEVLENVVVGYISSGFLDYAAALPDSRWLTILAQQQFNVTVPPASNATCSVTLTNSGGGVYQINANDLTLKASATGQTYHNSSGGFLGAGGTLAITVTADVAGSIASATVGEIDTMVTNLLGVTCTNTTAAVGVDQQQPATTVQQCRNKLGSLSPNGPAAAYSYVALNPALTGSNNVTRARVYSNSTTGQVTIYVAGPSGALGPTDVNLVQTAILQWATPLCITPTTVSANNNVINVTYSAWLYSSANKTAAQAQADILAALTAVLAARPIGGDVIPPATTGSVYAALIQSTIESVYPQIFRVVLTTPSSDTAMANGDVPVLGTVSGTITIVPNPQ